MKTESTTSLTMKGSIVVDDAPPHIIEEVMDYFRLPNQSYAHALKRNPGAKFYLSPYIPYVKTNKATPSRVIIPRGGLGKVREILTRNGADFTVEDQRVTRRINVTSSVRLRPYQVGVPERITASHNGVAVLSTGAGKTILALEVIAGIKQKTLIVTPSKNILGQFVIEAKKYLTDCTVGVMQGKKHEISDVTITTIQTLQRRVKEKVIDPDEFGCVIADECQKYIPTLSRNAISYFNAKYLYGFSGTPDRSDGQGGAIKWVFGDELCNIEMKRDNPTVHVIEYKGHLWSGEYFQIIEEQVGKEDRNQLIADVVKKMVKDNRKVLVLTKRVSHRDRLAELIHCKNEVLSTDRKDREELMRGLKDGSNDFECILATYSLAGVGTDIPSLDTVVLAGDLKSAVLQEQAIGRCLRLLEGKPRPIIVDVHDTGNGCLKFQGKSRLELYKKKGWEVIPTPSLTIQSA